MHTQKVNAKLREWLRRYIPAEILGTVLALAFAWEAYARTHSYLAAAGSGFVGEGIGFYGYFIVTELWRHGLQRREVPLYKRLHTIIGQSGLNLLVEFAPAEILDSVVIRPAAMFLVPQFIKPYALGFLAGKLGADVLFYVFAVVGYELKKRWLRP
ncbi:MAG TPA: hypothetical protein VLF71_01135 [Candidatus Saccharimonadales bacterium]|nr:hypothetical protein [Candidatus Saccharimonadales bacterium]